MLRTLLFAKLQRLTLLALALCLPAAATAAGSLFRAYLASDGSDANPCTLPQPCRLLPAALAAVADQGEIWMLDSANFNSGMVDVDKSVSILAVPGAIGSIVATGGFPAMTLSASNSRVGLRNVVVVTNILNPGTHGVTVSGIGARLSVEDSLFAGLGGNAIFVTGTGANGRLTVSNTTFRNNSGYVVSATNAGQIHIASSKMFGNSSNVAVSNTVSGATHVTVTDCAISGGTSGVAVVASNAGSTVRGYVTRTTIQGTTFALEAAEDASSTASLAISGNSIVNNNSAFVVGSGTEILTTGNNQITGWSTTTGTLTTEAAR